MWQDAQFFRAVGQAAPGWSAVFFAPIAFTWQLKQAWSYVASSVSSCRCGSWHAMQVNRASPWPQHLLDSRRYGCERTPDTPVIPPSFTSQKVAWHAPQKSTESTGDSFAELKIRVGPASARPESFAACIAETCFVPGLWQASQLTPGVRFFSSTRPLKTDAV